MTTGRGVWAVAAAAALAGVTVLSACETDEGFGTEDRSASATTSNNIDTAASRRREMMAPRIRVNTSSRNLLEGEIATLTVNSENTIGRNADVEWSSTGGDIRTEDNGRIARVYFPRPGNYTVAAALLVDGREVDRQSVNIAVKPIR